MLKLAIFNTWIWNYGQFLTVKVHINGEYSIIYGRWPYIVKETVLGNRSLDNDGSHKSVAIEDQMVKFIWTHRYLINRIDQTSRSWCFEATGPVNKWSGS